MTVRLNLVAPFSPLLARARRPRRHDGVAQGGAGEPATSSAPSRCAPVRSSSSSASRRTASCSSAIPNYWNKGQIHFDKIIYLPIVDATVRLANLKSGQLDFIERVAPSDVAAIKTENKLEIARITEIGYQGITINIGKSDLAQKNPLGSDPRVREAFELSLDRDGIVRWRWTARPTPATSGCRRATASTPKTCRSPSATSRAPRRC